MEKLSYYQRNRNNPEFMKKLREQQKLRRKELSKDPAIRAALREYGRRRYHKRIKKCPVMLDRKRERTTKYQQARREKQQEIRRQLQQEIGGSCVDCGLTDWRLLDFDHIDPITKTMNISQGLHLPYLLVLMEARKCQLRCPNCHRLKTMAQGGHDSRIRVFRNPRKKSSFS